MAKIDGNLANLDHLDKYIIIITLYMKMAKMAMFLVCS